jgi:ATP-binding cassette subfamily B multidrug efflux pump
MQTPGALREVAEASIRAVWYLSMYGLTSVVLLANADWRLTVPILAWFAGFVLLLRSSVPQLRGRADDNADKYSRLMAELVDGYGNILTVKLFGVAATMDGPVRKALLAHDDAQARHMKSVTGFMTWLTLLNTGLLLGTAAIGGFLWLHETVSAEAVAMALPLVWQVANTGGWVAWEVSGIYQNLGEVRQGMGVIAAPTAMPDDDAAPALDARFGGITFDRVTFGYGNQPPVLQDFSLDIAPGEKLGIVGRSGAGKSTLIALLLRLADIQGGEIRIDGQDIRAVSAESLRADRRCYARCFAVSSLDPRQSVVRQAASDRLRTRGCAAPRAGSQFRSIRQRRGGVPRPRRCCRRAWWKAIRRSASASDAGARAAQGRAYHYSR